MSFKPLSMRHISLKVLVEELPLAAQILAEYGVFNPESSSETIVEQLPDELGESLRKLFNQAHSRLIKIANYSSFDINQASKQSVDNIVTQSKLETVNTQLGHIWSELSKFEEQLHKLREKQANSKQLLETLQIFTKLNLDLKNFHKPKQFLNLHIGTIPVENLNHLVDALTLAKHFAHIFHQDDYNAYFVAAGSLEHQEQVTAILEHADFQILSIPKQFHDYPQQVNSDLVTELEQTKFKIKSITKQIEQFIQKNRADLNNAHFILNQTAAYSKLTEFSRGRGQLVVIEGWVPKLKSSELKTILETQLQHPFVLDIRKPMPAEYSQVPSLIQHHKLLAPFAALVKNYGIPRYSEFDPTILFAISFILMFGTMFGDVGHGGLIVLAGWYWRGKLKEFMPFFIAAGLSSICFGFLYGSFFGFEETIIPALWLSPIHNPNIMLTIALYWGIGFILLAILITIVNQWREKEYAAALFNHTGVAGIFLYLGGFYAIDLWMATDIFATTQQLAVLLPLAIILLYKWHENKLPLTERILVTLIEGLESIINYLANTLSFLRVAAFSLNHAALAIAVITLANMMEAPASWIAIILGNLFIVVVEGAIVTIQVLRLEYYEGFSRFFSGDGREFAPLTPGIKKINSLNS